MERFAKRFLIPLLLCGVVVNAAPAQDKPIEVILTGNLHMILPPATDDPEIDGAPARLEAELAKLRAEEPQRYLLDAGRSHSLSFAHESGYNFQSTRFFLRNNYDAANLDSRDVFATQMNPRSYHESPPGYRERLASNITTVYTSRDPLAPSARVHRSETEPGLTIVSFHDRSYTTGLGINNTRLEELPAEKVAEALAEGRTREDYVVLFTSKPSAAVSSLISDETRRPHLIVATEGVTLDLGDGAPPVIASPRLGEAKVLRLSPEDGVEELRTIEYLPEKKYTELVKPQIGDLGMPIPNLSGVLLQLLGVEPAALAEDRFQQSEFGGLTTRENPMVYRVTMPGGKLIRLYRLNNFVPWYRHPGFYMLSYPELNIIIAIREDHTFDQIIARHKAPVLGENTAVIDGVNTQSGKKIEDWDIPSEFTAGADELLAWITLEVERAIEVDKKLYGEK